MTTRLEALEKLMYACVNVIKDIERTKPQGMGEASLAYFIQCHKDALKALDECKEPGDGWRPEVIAFADLMEAQLKANDSRGGWKSCDRVYFMEKLEINLRDLGFNLKAGAIFQAKRDCADIANFAMMLADNEGFLPSPPKGA